MLKQVQYEREKYWGGSMGMNKVSINKKTMAEQVAERLLTRIFSGHYHQGQRLIEAEIAKELQVSHAPVREALYLLQKDGVVEKVQHKGVHVRVISDKELNDYLETLDYLVQFVLKECESDWEELDQKNLNEQFEVIQSRKDRASIYEYVESVADLLQLFFDRVGNLAMLRFFKETTFVTNVAAQTKWKMDAIEEYHESIRLFVDSIERRDFDSARSAIQKVILWVSI